MTVKTQRSHTAACQSRGKPFLAFLSLIYHDVAGWLAGSVPCTCSCDLSSVLFMITSVDRGWTVLLVYGDTVISLSISY